MCFPVKCNLCGKTTWSGCGLHVDMVMRGIPPEQRCHCPRSDIHPPGPSQKSMAPPTDDVTKIGNCCKTPESAQPPMSSASDELVKEITSSEQFKEELKKADNALVVVDFYASWCAPCKLMAPKFAALANEFKGKAIFLKVNGNKCPECIDDQGVTAFPSFHLYRCSSLLDEIVGVKEADLRNAISLHV